VNLLTLRRFRVFALIVLLFGALMILSAYFPRQGTVVSACHKAGKSTLAGDGTQVCDCTAMDDTCTCILPPKDCGDGGPAPLE